MSYLGKMILLGSIMYLKIIILVCFLLLANIAESKEVVGTLYFRSNTPKAGVVFVNQEKVLPIDIVIDQNNALFSNFVYVTQPGASVEFKNTDGIRHNIFTRNIEIDFKFDAGILKKDTSVHKTVDWEKNSISRLACYLHNTMEAYLVVIDSNNYAVLDFRAPVSLGKKTSGYTSRFARPITKLESRRVFKLSNVNKGTELQLLFPYQDLVSIKLNSNQKQSHPIVFNGQTVGTLEVEFEE